MRQSASVRSASPLEDGGSARNELEMPACSAYSAP